MSFIRKKDSKRKKKKGDKVNKEQVHYKNFRRIETGICNYMRKQNSSQVKYKKIQVGKSDYGTGTAADCSSKH